MTNLSKVIKDPKTLFYNRKYLRGLDLIRTCHMTEVIGGKGVKALLVRLKRFYTPSLMSMPKSGVLRNVIEYLLQQPDYSEKTEVIIKKGLLTQKQNKRLQKTVNIFNFVSLSSFFFSTCFVALLGKGLPYSLQLFPGFCFLRLIRHECLQVIS